MQKGLPNCSRRALAHQQAGRLAEAEPLYRQVLAAAPRHLDTLNNCGVALHGLGRLDEALLRFNAALAVKPDHAPALNNRGNLLRAMQRGTEALASFDAAIRAQPDFADAWINRGALLWELRDLPQALASLDQARSLSPSHPDMLLNRGVVLREMRRLGEALDSLDAAVAARPAFAEAHYQRGQTLQLLDRLTDAAACFECALTLDSRHAWAAGALAGTALQLCDWPGATRAAAALGAAHVIVQPLTMLSLRDDPAVHLEYARRFLRGIAAPAISRSVRPVKVPSDRIRVAYLSSDFKEHATAYLVAELFERHDRVRFDVLGVSMGPDDASPMRRRLERAFDHFLDVRLTGDRAVAEQLAGLEIDILVDMHGHTFGARPGIAARRPAPVQVSFLGYPGTMGADFIDYVIADETVLPRREQHFYTEQIVHLPGSYQVNSRRDVAKDAPSRSACGLPESGFVFCCFNNGWKISTPLFDVWMRLLQGVPQSVLWLMAGPETAANLRREAAARGVDPGRLVFAPRMAQREHLARHHHADLFLDTLPYNAHTTGSDALWMGLPIVTCMGNSFASRVAASLLKTAGLPELVTGNLEEYEALALRLAAEPSLLQSFRNRLAQPERNKLFDSTRFCRKLEAAYAKMMDIAHASEAPRGFAVMENG